MDGDLAPRIEEANYHVGADPRHRKPTRPVGGAQHEYPGNKSPLIRQRKSRRLRRGRRFVPVR
jgi:hypothetical protein